MALQAYPGYWHSFINRKKGAVGGGICTWKAEVGGDLSEFQVRENHIVIAWGRVSGAEGGRALA